MKKSFKSFSKYLLVTGGAGFIGSNFISHWLSINDSKIVNLDLLSYAGNTNNLQSLCDTNNYVFVQGNIADQVLVSRLLQEYKPFAIINFAAETHVDRSIINSSKFINTNIIGTHVLLESSRNYWSSLSEEDKQMFRFINISTDEVYGSLTQKQAAFTEHSLYQPNSPYAASKAAADHLVRAWYHTYKLPIITTHCSNNYGPFQFPEKLIPLVIVNAINGNLLPIYGNGNNIRDWLFVNDHCEAISTVLQHGFVGQTYNIGGNSEKTNLEVVYTICSLMDKLLPLTKRTIVHPTTQKKLEAYCELIAFVPDRLGHDKRYAINANKITQELGWRPKESFETGIIKTVEWYINNTNWVNDAMNKNNNMHSFVKAEGLIC